MFSILDKLTKLMGNDQKKAQATTSYHPDIVVVSEKAASATTPDDSELNKLQYVPLFYPILKSSIDLKEDHPLYQINPDYIIKLGECFQNHLNNCALNVTKEQEAISIEIKHLNFVIDMLMANFVEKQKKYAKYCEQFKSVHDLSNNLKKIQRSMNEILPMMKEINNCLPDSEKLEEFTFD